MALTHLSLFSGIGGLDIAAEWAGFETVGQCEWADYPTKVLEKHWPNVPRWRDIRTLTGENFYERTGLRTVDIISGGFPCQPFSVAGKQKGKGDDRYLWPEMLRVIRELTPTWVIGENVPGILRIAGRTVCEDLEREGYAVTVLNYEAAAVGALHRRERVFFVANARSRGCGRQGRVQGYGEDTAAVGERASSSFVPTGEDVADTEHYGFTSSEIAGRIEQRGDTNAPRQDATSKPSGCCGGTTGCNDVADTESVMRETCLCADTEGSSGFADGSNASNSDGEGLSFSGPKPELSAVSAENGIKLGGWWSTEPELGGMVDGLSDRLHGYWRVEPDIPRVATGVKNRVDRLKCLGNAVVPAQAYPIFAAIAQIEMEAQP